MQRRRPLSPRAMLSAVTAMGSFLSFHETTPQYLASACWAAISIGLSLLPSFFTSSIPLLFPSVWHSWRMASYVISSGGPASLLSFVATHAHGLELLDSSLRQASILALGSDLDTLFDLVYYSLCWLMGFGKQGMAAVGGKDS